MVRKNIISSLIAIIILVLSLTGQSTFNKLNIPPIPYLDKLVHASMYFALMSALIFENRKILKGPKNYFILATIPLIFGAAIEMMQTLFTSDRTGDILDILFNLTGIILSVGLWLLIKRLKVFRS
jgi:VanZ family protein